MDYGLVSIITANYNSEHYLSEAIESVKAQTYTNWELLIQDDCSTGGDVALVQRYAAADSRIRLEVNATNDGAALTRNAALRRAKGHWVAFLDSDDLWEPEKLERQLRFMVEGGYAFSYTEYIEVDENDHPLGVKVSGPRRITKTGMFNYCWPGSLTVMYDAEKIGLVQIEPIKINNDYAKWLQISRKADCYLLPQVLARYRRHTGSLSRHGYLSLIQWHWKLYRNVEHQNQIISGLNTVRNLIFGTIKKIVYVRKMDI